MTRQDVLADIARCVITATELQRASIEALVATLPDQSLGSRMDMLEGLYDRGLTSRAFVRQYRLDLLEQEAAAATRGS